MSSAHPEVTGYYHAGTGSIAYLVVDPATQKAAIIDPVLDYDEKAARVSTQFAEAILADIRARRLSVEWILDTHPHADHFSATAYLKDKLGAPTAIGEKIIEVQRLWRDIYNTPDLVCDGSQWDRLFADGATFSIGSLTARVMLTPGHTLASITYLIGDAAFIHDTLLQPDSGTARADFPGGSAETLYRSIMAIFALPPETRVFVGHDYCPNGRKAQWQSTVAEHRRSNVHIKDGTSCEQFVQMRQARDRTLGMPRQILHALQVNIRGGRLPPPDSNGRTYLRIPINAL